MKGKRIILIGEADSKRTEFFFKAAVSQQVSVDFYTWSEWSTKNIEGGVVKIDPPSFHAYNILTLSDSGAATKKGWQSFLSWMKWDRKKAFAF